jgi:dUTP pyrophosphatase
MLNFKFIRLTPTAKLPVRATGASAGYDVFADNEEPIHLRHGQPAVFVPTGLKIEMLSGLKDEFPLSYSQSGISAIMLPRSGLGHKQGLVLGNTAGVIDADYQGEWKVSVFNRGNGENTQDICIKRGDRIAQVMFVPVIFPTFTEVEGFDIATDRGEGGFGSTGVTSEAAKQ